MATAFIIGGVLVAAISALQWAFGPAARAARHAREIERQLEEMGR